MRKIDVPAPVRHVQRVDLGDIEQVRFEWGA
jgi:hypothetical protein